MKRITGLRSEVYRVSRRQGGITVPPVVVIVTTGIIIQQCLENMGKQVLTAYYLCRRHCLVRHKGQRPDASSIAETFHCNILLSKVHHDTFIIIIIQVSLRLRAVVSQLYSRCQLSLPPVPFPMTDTYFSFSLPSPYSP